jgi:Dna[CI] antecedent, DciA
VIDWTEERAGERRTRTDRSRDLVAMTDALDSVVIALRPSSPSDPGDGSNHRGLRTLASRWLDAVGATVAAHASPVRIDGTRLVVVVDDPAWATQLRYLDAELRARLERVLGPGAVQTIDVVVRRERGRRTRANDVV